MFRTSYGHHYLGCTLFIGGLIPKLGTHNISFLCVSITASCCFTSIREIGDMRREMGNKRVRALGVRALGVRALGMGALGG